MTNDMMESRPYRGTVVVLCPDLFFLVGLRNTLRRLGFEPLIVRTTDDLEESASSVSPALVIVDMSAVDSEADWDAIRPYVRHGVPVLAFGPHKDVDAFQWAKEAGATRVVANSLFHRDMAGVIERYANVIGDSDNDGELEATEDERSGPQGARIETSAVEGDSE